MLSLTLVATISVVSKFENCSRIWLGFTLMMSPPVSFAKFDNISILDSSPSKVIKDMIIPYICYI